MSLSLQTVSGDLVLALVELREAARASSLPRTLWIAPDPQVPPTSVGSSLMQIPSRTGPSISPWGYIAHHWFLALLLGTGTGSPSGLRGVTLKGLQGRLGAAGQDGRAV